MYFVKDVLIDPENLPPTIPLKGAVVEIVLMIKSGTTFKVVCGYTIQAKVKPLS